MTRSIDLSVREQEMVRKLLARFLPNTEAWVYGSRVHWTSRPESDLDMVVFTTPEQAGAVSKLREAFDESDLTFRVDLFVWDNVPPEFRHEIEREHVVLVESATCSRGWKQRQQLGDCILMNEDTYSPKEKWPFVNYLETGNISENRIEKILHIIPEREKLPSRARRKARSGGEIVYSTVRPNQRHFGILREVPENFLASTEFAIFRGKEAIADTGFIYRFLIQDHVVERLHTIAEHSTSAYPSIRPADIERLEISLPPVAEQRTIANILGKLDDKIELNRQMNETLEAMARAIFKDWFVDFGPTRAKSKGLAPYLTPELWDLFPDALDDEDKPVGWSLAELTAVADINPESWSRINCPEEVEYVDLANTKWGTIEATHRFDWQQAPSRAKRVLRPGDTIVGMVRPGNGSFAFIGVPGLTGSTGFAVLRPLENRHSEVVYLAATDPENIKRLANLADGAAYPSVRPEVVGATEIAVSDDAVIASFSALVSPLFDRMETNKVEENALVQTRDFLLPKLISGEIRLNQAKKLEEPAS